MQDVKSQIQNPPNAVGWLTNPGCSSLINAGSKALGQFGSSTVRVTTCCCWHVFQTHSSDFLTGRFAEPSLRPFWHRVLREAGAGQPSTSIYKELSSFRRSSSRPRARRDFTVPILICSVAAISSYASPSMSRNTTASRYALRNPCSASRN